MNRNFAIAFLGLCFVVGGFVRAEAQSAEAGAVAFVDLQRTLNETKAGKAAKKRLENTKAKRQRELDKKQKALQKAATELEKQRIMLKPDVLKKRERQLQEKYVKLQETYMELQQGLVAEEGKLVKEIFAKAAPAIKSVAKEKGYVMVLDKSMVLWAGNGLDITGAVNKRIK
ncbi:MAG: OmpH family outer membrane protein [Myxococcales bacterium]|nr:OmpH family outer membrane protein [Myxococcales bacterium]